MTPTRDEDLRAIDETLLGLRERELRGFSAPKDPGGRGSESSAHVHRFALEVTGLTDFIALVLDTVPARSAVAGGGARWKYEFEFRGVHCWLWLAKSGLRLQTDETGHTTEELADLHGEVERRLTRAARSLYSRVVRPIVERELASNRAQLVNQYGRYRGMVDYFLGELGDRQSAAASVAPAAWGTGSHGEILQMAIQTVLDNVRQREELAYLCTAFLAAYFSYVHHACVILAAFSARALDDAFSLKGLLGAEWAEQFDAAFPKPRSAQVERAKSDLGFLARVHRNRLLHGGGRSSDGIVVEWALGRHAIVSGDSEPTSRFMLWQAALEPHEVEDIINRVAAIDAAIESHPFFSWLSDGLPADFRPDAVLRARQALSEGRVEAYVQAVDRAYEHELNGD